MKTCMGFSTLILLLIIKLLQTQCLPINNPGEPSTSEVYEQSQRTKFVDDVTKQLLHAIEKLKFSSDSRKRFRQDEEDDDELPELVPGILKIVGSALAGNASALIDSSISLIPEEVHSSISGALNVLVNSINSARPTKAPVRAPVKVANTTASPLKPTTEEDEEDDEDKTDLRTNSSANANISTTISTRFNNSDITTELFALTFSQTTPTTAVPPLSPSPRTNPPITSSPISTVAPQLINSNNNFGGESFDQDNKANWMSLVDTNSNNNDNNNYNNNNNNNYNNNNNNNNYNNNNNNYNNNNNNNNYNNNNNNNNYNNNNNNYNNYNNTSSNSESFSNPIDEIDVDNKANFNSLWGQNGESPSDATNNKPNNNNANILLSSKLSMQQLKPNPTQEDSRVQAKTSRPELSQSNWNTNNSPQKPQSFFSLSIRDNSKAPGQKLSNYASNQPGVILPGVPSSSLSSSGIGNKLNALLLTNSKPINSFIGDKLSEKENDSEETQNVNNNKPVASLTVTSAPVILPNSRPEPTPNTINSNNNSNSQELSSEEDDKESVSSSSSSPVSKSTGNAPLYSNYADKFAYGKGNVTTTSEPQSSTESTTADDDDEEEDEDSK